MSVIAERILKWLMEERRNHEPREDHVYASELGLCRQKRVYRLLFPELDAAKYFEPRVLMGVIVHAGVERLLEAVYGDAVRTEWSGDTSGERPVMVGGSRYVVRGRMDAVIEDRVGVEIKYMEQGPPQSPLPWHEAQARVYNWLFNLQKTVLLYVTPRGLREFEVYDAYTSQDIASMISRGPSPRYEWECRNCPFALLCPYARVSRGEGGEASGSPATDR